MSSSRDDDDVQPNDLPSRSPGEYTETYEFADWTEDYLPVQLSDAQRAIHESVRDNQRTLIIGANGFGKSYSVACLILGWLYTNPPSKALATSGTYGKLKRTLCHPIEQLHRTAQRTRGLPGEYKQRPPRVTLGDIGFPEWYFEAARPRDAGELEGTHSDHLLAVVEEVDKDAVDERVIDSMESLMTDDRDRIIAIGNPPKDEANVAYQLMEDDSWNTLQFSSFESHNVKHGIDRGDDGYISGLVTLPQIRDDWESWNSAPWPGAAEAPRAHHDDDMRPLLDERWYRRRVGEVPPATASVHRPIQSDAVEQGCIDTADSLEKAREAGTPLGVAIDVARRGGDWNVLSARYPSHIHVWERWQGMDHRANRALIRRYLRQWGGPPTAIDAQGEGSGLADMLHGEAEFDIRRFNAGGKASEATRFYDNWTEGLYYLGQFLKEGGTIGGEGPIKQELAAAARSLELSEQHYASRSATVLKCNSKDDVKEQLERSPDVLDSCYMAEHVAGPEAGHRSGQHLTW